MPSVSRIVPANRHSSPHTPGVVGARVVVVVVVVARVVVVVTFGVVLGGGVHGVVGGLGHPVNSVVAL